MQAVTLEALGEAVDRMLAAGDIRNCGAAESPRAFLAQAARAHGRGDAAGERAALQRFQQHVRSLAGKQIAPVAAERLDAMAGALLR